MAPGPIIGRIIIGGTSGSGLRTGGDISVAPFDLDGARLPVVDHARQALQSYSAAGFARYSRTQQALARAVPQVVYPHDFMYKLPFKLCQQ